MLIALSIFIIVTGIIITILWLLGINILPAIAIIDNSNFYLLSAIAQSLAAVLALVFTISLIATQISSKYSYRMLGRFLDWITILYMAFFIAAVLFPLLLLAYPQPKLLEVSIVSSAVCLILLIPFLWRFRSRLSAESMLNDNKKGAIHRIQKGTEKEPSEVLTIDNFIMSAFVQKDYDTFSKGVECLTEIAIEAFTRERKDVNHYKEAVNKLHKKLQDAGIVNIPGPGSPSLVYKILDRIEDISAITIGDPRAPFIILDELYKSCRKAIDNRWEIAYLLAFIISNMGEVATQNKQEEVAIRVIDVLTDIIIEGMGGEEKPSNIADRTASILGAVIGVLAVDNHLYATAYRIIEGLCKAFEQAINSGKNELAGRYAYDVTTVLDRLGVKVVAFGLENSSEAGVSRRSCEISIIPAFEPPKSMGEVASKAADVLSYMGHQAIDKNTSGDKDLESTVVHVAHTLGAVGFSAAQECLPNATYNMVSSLIDFGKDCAKKNLAHATWVIVNCLQEILEPAVAGNIDNVIQKICIATAIMGAWTDSNSNADLKKHVCEITKKTEEAIGSQDLRSAFSAAESQLISSGRPELVDCLKRFVECYEHDYGRSDATRKDG